MSEPFIKPVGNKTKQVELLMISVVGTAVVILGVWVGLNYARYRRSGGLPAKASFPAQVAISFPPNGVQIEAGEPLMVEADALGPHPFLSMELWLDGELVGVQAAPEGGRQPFSAEFFWQTSELGAHSLIAVAVDGNGQKVISAQVVVLVGQGEVAVEDLVLQVVQPEPSDGYYVPPFGPGEGSSVGPAGIWGGTPGNWINSFLVDEIPLAPELVVRPNKCAANLLIHDLSDNEEGFVVYRHLVNSPDWLKVSTLSAQSEMEWIEYVDEGISGPVTYYISTFNSQGEVKSNLTQVNIDPADCPTEQESLSVESVDMTLKLTEVEAEKVYCYQSHDGVNWERWPIVGFLSPDEAGNLPEGPIAFLRKEPPGEVWGFNSLGLMMDCWGWQGGDLIRVGDFAVGELKPDPTGRQLINGEGVIAEVKFKLEKISTLAGLLPLQINVMDEDQPNLPSNLPVSPDIPRVKLSLTSDRNICGAHLPPHIQSYDEQLQFCFLYPEYDPDNGGTSPQPYLVWDFDPEPVCLGGGGEECKTYKEILDLAEQNGGQVGFTILSVRGTKKTVWNVTEPGLTMFVVPPLFCLGDTTFSVRMWYRPGTQGVSESVSPQFEVGEIGADSLSIPKTHYGPYSNWITIPCNSSNLYNPSIVEMVQYYDVTFDWMWLGSLDDDDLGTEVVELYGNFWAWSPAMNFWVEAPCWFSGFDNCDSDHLEPTYIEGGGTRYLLLKEWKSSKGEDFIDGMYALEWEKLCLSTTRVSCSHMGEPTYFKSYNNTLKIYKREGESLSIGVILMDYDEASYDDTVCQLWYGVWSSEPFLGEFTLSGETDSGNCAVKIKIEKVGDPVPLDSP